jgi:hypothetical protein
MDKVGQHFSITARGKSQLPCRPDGRRPRNCFNMRSCICFIDGLAEDFVPSTTVVSDPMMMHPTSPCL